MSSEFPLFVLRGLCVAGGYTAQLVMPYSAREENDDPSVVQNKLSNTAVFPKGFSVDFKETMKVGKKVRYGFYNVNIDPRLKTEKQKQIVVEMLMEHRSNGVYFKLYDPSEEDAGVSVADIDNLQAQLDEAKRKIASLEKK